MIIKKPIKIALFIIMAGITGANSAVLALTYKTYNKTGGTEVVNIAPPLEDVKQESPVVGSKAKRIDDSQLGVAFATGKYDFETLDHSKYVDTDPNATGQLALATYEATKAHFILALGANAKISQPDVNEGWKMQTVSVDQIWQPGACASKPTQLLGGRYIFIDDGKTDPKDAYGSYILFDIQTSKYKYFGGSHFTKQQGDKEHIVKVANENDKIVFYVDPIDDNATEGLYSQHHTNADHGYIIRRELNAETLNYTDYKLALDIPNDFQTYTVYGGFGNYILSVSGTSTNVLGSYVNYSGEVKNNRITLSNNATTANFNDSDTQVELKLNDRLKSTLPDFTSVDPKNSTGTPSQYKTAFSASVIGSFENTSYLVVSSRSSSKQVPAVYVSDTDKLQVMTNKAIFDFSNYVPLGVY